MRWWDPEQQRRDGESMDRAHRRETIRSVVLGVLIVLSITAAITFVKHFDRSRPPDPGAYSFPPIPQQRVP